MGLGFIEISSALPSYNVQSASDFLRNYLEKFFFNSLGGKRTSFFQGIPWKKKLDFLGGDGREVLSFHSLL